MGGGAAAAAAPAPGAKSMEDIEEELAEFVDNRILEIQIEAIEEATMMLDESFNQWYILKKHSVFIYIFLMFSLDNILNFNKDTQIYNKNWLILNFILYYI